jgi:hypothetical protein
VVRVDHVEFPLVDGNRGVAPRRCRGKNKFHDRADERITEISVQVERQILHPGKLVVAFFVLALPGERADLDQRLAPIVVWMESILPSQGQIVPERVVVGRCSKTVDGPGETVKWAGQEKERQHPV